MKIPSSRPVGMSALSETELNAELEKGYADIKAGKTNKASAFFQTSVRIITYDLYNQDY